MKFCTILVLLIFVSVGVGQPVEDGWEGIKPLVTTREVVEQELGKPEIDDNGYYRYRTKKAFVTVNFSTAPCIQAPYGRGEYRVPEGTVLNYRVFFNDPFRNPIKLEFDPKTYVRDTSGDAGSIMYTDGKSGVMIFSEHMNGVEYFTSLLYQPPKERGEKLRCSTGSNN